MTEIDQLAMNVFQDLQREAKETAVYRRLRARRYRNPAGYPAWETVASAIAGFMRFVQMRGGLDQCDWTSQATGTLCGQIAYQSAPCYWLSNALAEALGQTDLPPVGDLRKLMPVGVLMLPKGLLRNPDGYAVDWLGVMQVEQDEFAGQYVEVHGALPPDGSRVIWSHILPSGVAYCQSIGILPDQAEPQRGAFQASSTLDVIEIDDAAENRFVRAVSDLVLKCLVVMQSRPELIETAQAAATAPTLSRRAAKRGEGEGLLNPNWIGKNYQPRRESLGGTHASPTMHWRRGHLKRVAIGEGRRERKWVWIEPTLVMGGDRP